MFRCRVASNVDLLCNESAVRLRRQPVGVMALCDDAVEVSAWNGPRLRVKMVTHREARDAAAQETRTVAGPDDRVDVIVPKGHPGYRGRIDGQAERTRMPRREERVM